MDDELIRAFIAHVAAKVMCTRCQGTGTIPPTYERRLSPNTTACGTCKGEGWLDRPGA